MKLSKTARTLLSVTALAWSIPFAQAGDERPDASETASVFELRNGGERAPGVRTPAADREERIAEGEDGGAKRG